MTTTQRSDTDLQSAVANELRWVPSLDSANIGVAVADGTVTLSGEVRSFQEKLLAVQAAQRVAGVTAIAQEIAVHTAGWNDLNDLNDTDVARDAGRALEQAADVPVSIKAAVHDHVITLSGEGYQYERVAAERSVRYLRGVRDVVDNVRLRISRMASAASIEEAIGQALARDFVIDRTLVSVSCAADGAVTLEGTVRSWDELGQAEYAAWTASGVTSVTDNLQIGNEREPGPGGGTHRSDGAPSLAGPLPAPPGR